jgi:tetraacyldisaccharide 4'-kinase
MDMLASLVKGLLSIPAAVYSVVQKSHESAYQIGILKVRTAPIPVVSVGNLLLGGSGKTPFTIYLANLLQTCGLQPAVVSRGYRGAYRADYLVVGDGGAGRPLVEPAECGDEPYLISSRLPRIPVLVGRKRIDPIVAAKELFGCNVVVLDDGFQHIQLARDADIVLLNGSEDAMFPRGSLREPLSALKRADMIIIVERDARLPVDAAPYVSDLPSFRCEHKPSELIGFDNWKHPGDLKGREVILASGIAHPHRFRKTAEHVGWNVKRHYEFQDHHNLTDEELHDLLAQAGDLPVIFTEKDWVKLPEWLRLSEPTGALRIDVIMHDESEFLRTLQKVTGLGLQIS